MAKNKKRRAKKRTQQRSAKKELMKKLKHAVSYDEAFELMDKLKTEQ